MADIEFIISKRENNKALGTVSWPSKNLSSTAISGPYGKGALPNGLYVAKRIKLLDKTEDSYRDKTGKPNPGHCWMQAFEDAYGRTELGIHPDGGVLGTEGCIGLEVVDTKGWYDAFYVVDGQVTVEVREA